MRESGTIDYIPVVLTEEINYKLNERIEIFGEVRTANVQDGDRRRLIVYILADAIYFTDKDYINEVKIEGRICKKSPIRSTPTGKRITDVILAVNKQYGKSYYIPSVFWNRDADLINTKEIGYEVRGIGRLQSRQYAKDNKIFEVVELSIVEVY